MMDDKTPQFLWYGVIIEESASLKVGVENSKDKAELL